MIKPLLFATAAALGFSQTPKIALHVAPLEKITAKPGQTVRVTLSATVDEGYHVNSNKPAEAFLIPLALTWQAGVLEKAATTFPKPEVAKLQFSEKPVLVFTGTFGIATQFKVAANAKPGEGSVTGKLRFQACNDRECLIPRVIDVNVPVEITN